MPNYEEEKYFNDIDFLKGIAIILIIFAHLSIPLPSIRFIYKIGYIQAPILFSSSGFLLQEKTFLNKKFIDLIKKYFFRLIIPYLIAWSIFFIYYYYDLIINHTLTIEFVFSSIILPEYHLWFIPSLIAFIIFTWIIKRINISDYLIFIAIILITILIVILFNYHILNSYKLFDNLINKYRPDYYIFFFLGYSLRNRKIDPRILKKFKYIGLIILPLFVYRSYYYFIIEEELLTWDLFFISTIVIIFYLLFFKQL